MPDQDQRIRCRYCGSNNFAGTTTCWQCNRSLLISQNQNEVANAGPSQPANPADNWSNTPPVPAFSRSVDSSTADKAAIFLGFFFWPIAYPVGIVFMMLDDERKTQLGKLTLLWSTIGLVVSVVLTMMSLGPLVAMSSKMIPSGTSLKQLAPPTDDSN